LAAFVQRLLPRLRYPYLFLALACLLLVDLVVPDPVPLVDELVLAILTFIAATLTTRSDDRPPPRDVTPNEDPSGLSAGEDQEPSSAPPR
jgi:hypothetical protein